MYYYAMCGTCPTKSNWYRQSEEKPEVEAWADRHLAQFGHPIAMGEAETPFNPRRH